jgi:hypothetical protein
MLKSSSSGWWSSIWAGLSFSVMPSSVTGNLSVAPGQAPYSMAGHP